MTVDNYLLGTPSEQAFYEKTGGASNGVLVVAASGKKVGDVEGGGGNLKRLLEEFRKLPDSDRKPKVERTSEAGNPQAMPPPFPQGGLALIAYNTPLERNSRGELVRAPNLMGPGPSWNLKVPITLNDLVWLKREEWQALVPHGAQKGMKGAVPANVSRRIFRLYGYDWMSAYQNDAPVLRQGSLTATVDSVTSTEVGLRLEGNSAVGGTEEDLRKCGHEDAYRCGHWGADLAWLGFVKIDRAKGSIVQFQLVGSGETRQTRDRRSGKPDGRPHSVPTGVVVELASDCSANRTGWPPLADVRLQHGFDYWNPK